MRAGLLLVLVAVATSGSSSAPRRPPSVVSGKARAIDGDTVSLDFRLSGEARDWSVLEDELDDLRAALGYF